MVKESGHWNPSHWSEGKLRLYLRHVVKHAIAQAVAMDGIERATLILGDFVGSAKDNQSAVMLNRMGVKTIGDATAERTS